MNGQGYRMGWCQGAAWNGWFTWLRYRLPVFVPY